MAHDFYIHRKDNKENMGTFFGYCNGVMYHAFNHLECDMGISGDGSTHIITKIEAIKGLATAVYIFNRSNYPDPTRMDDLKQFLIELLCENDEPDDTLYKIAFM